MHIVAGEQRKQYWSKVLLLSAVIQDRPTSKQEYLHHLGIIERQHLMGYFDTQSANEKINQYLGSLPVTPSLVQYCCDLIWDSRTTQELFERFLLYDGLPLHFQRVEHPYTLQAIEKFEHIRSIITVVKLDVNQYMDEFYMRPYILYD